MALLVKLIEILFGLTYSKRKRIANEIKLLDKVLSNENDEKLKTLYFAQRKRLSFQFISGFKAELKDIDLLIDLQDSLGSDCWYLIGDAYKFWKIESGVIDTTVSNFQKRLASVMFVAIFSIWGTGGIFGFFVAKWQHEPVTSYYFLIAFGCFTIGMILLFVFAPYQAAIVIENKLRKKDEPELPA